MKRYFLVFFQFMVNDYHWIPGEVTMFSSTFVEIKSNWVDAERGGYLNREEVVAEIKKKAKLSEPADIKAVIITNIVELNEQDYNEWIRPINCN